MSEPKPWVVLKFGGTSVSSVSNWHNIARVLRERIAEGLRPVVVHSALSGITDRLESLLTAAVDGAHGPGLERIEDAHRNLARDLGVEPGAVFETFLEELKSLTAEIAGSRQIDERRRARVMAMCELFATALGSAFSNAQRIAS